MGFQQILGLEFHQLGSVLRNFYVIDWVLQDSRIFTKHCCQTLAQTDDSVSWELFILDFEILIKVDPCQEEIRYNLNRILFLSEIKEENTLLLLFLPNQKAFKEIFLPNSAKLYFSLFYILQLSIDYLSFSLAGLYLPSSLYSFYYSQLQRSLFGFYYRTNQFSLSFCRGTFGSWAFGNTTSWTLGFASCVLFQIFYGGSNWIYFDFHLQLYANCQICFSRYLLRLIENLLQMYAFFERTILLQLLRNINDSLAQYQPITILCHKSKRMTPKQTPQKLKQIRPHHMPNPQPHRSITTQHSSSNQIPSPMQIILCIILQEI